MDEQFIASLGRIKETEHPHWWDETYNQGKVVRDGVQRGVFDKNSSIEIMRAILQFFSQIMRTYKSNVNQNCTVASKVGLVLCQASIRVAIVELPCHISISY
jgi:hypothetical protein